MVLSFIHTVIKYKTKTSNNTSETQHLNTKSKSFNTKNVSIEFISKTYQQCKINAEHQQHETSTRPTTSHHVNDHESKVYLENQKNSFIKSVLNYCVKYNSAVLIVGGLAESVNTNFLIKY